MNVVEIIAEQPSHVNMMPVLIQSIHFVLKNTQSNALRISSRLTHIANASENEYSNIKIFQIILFSSNYLKYE